MPGKPRYQKIDVELPKGEIQIYAGVKVRSAFDELKKDMTLYHGVRLYQVMEAVYEQGQKSGRKEILDTFDRLADNIKSRVNYLDPGRPKKGKKR